MSKEHIYADWTRVYIEKTVTSHGFIKTAVDSQSDTIRREDIAKPIAGDPRSRRVRWVCKICNTGWMSAFQDLAKPIATPLILGKPVVLGRREQHIIAIWAAMSVMTSEFSDPETAAIPQADRTWLYTYQAMPERWKIWIGYYPGGMDDPIWDHEASRLENLSPADGSALHSYGNDTQATSYSFGKLYVHAFSSENPGTVAAWNLTLAGNMVARQIWPIVHDFVEMPPFPPMTPSDAREIGFALHRFTLDLARKRAARLELAPHNKAKGGFC